MTIFIAMNILIAIPLIILSALIIIKKKGWRVEGIISMCIGIASLAFCAFRIITGESVLQDTIHVKVYDKEIVEISKSEKAYDYLIYYVYDDKCYTTEVNGKIYSEIDCSKGICGYEMPAGYSTLMKEISEPANTSTSTTAATTKM